MLSVKNLTGGYSIHQPVIHDVSLEVCPSEIVGLIGLNGAGKSTTIKHILGLISPQKGSVTLDGKSLSEDPVHFRSKMAFIPEAPSFYEELTLWEHLELTARAYQLPRKTFKERAEQLLDTFRMKKAAKWFPNTFSKGMQQKIMILSAFLVQPSYLIVDEPFVGLDPLAIQALLQMLEDGKEKGMGILMSTHILEMAGKYCDRFVILHEGRVKLEGTLAEMRRESGLLDASLEELFIQVAKG